MKNLKHKLFLSALTSALMMGTIPAIPIFAEDADPASSESTAIQADASDPAQQTAENFTIQLKNGVPNGKYSLYQLFSGSFIVDDPDMGDAVVNPACKTILIDAIKQFNPSFSVSGDDSEQSLQIADAISEISKAQNGNVNTQNLANVVANLMLEQNIAPAASLTADANGHVNFGSQASGYWLIVSQPDAGYDQDKGGYTSAILLPLDDNKTITVKTTDVTNVNKVAVINGQDQKYAEVQLIDGKVVAPQYQISGMVSGLYQYNKFPFQFLDTLPTGLTTTTQEVQESWNIKISATLRSKTGSETKDLTKWFTIAVGGTPSVIGVSAVDLKSVLLSAGFSNEQINGFNSSFEITQTYTPVYDAADIANLFDSPSELSKPQINSAMVEYPKSPYQKGDNAVPSTPGQTPSTPGEEPKPGQPGYGMGHAPASTVNTYSYNLQVNKLDKTGKNLTGAEFTLTESGKSAGQEITADQNGQFVFTGLKSGETYTLTETVVPTGMQALQPITFTITANPNDPKTAIVSIVGTLTSNNDNAAAVSVDDATVVMNVTNLPGRALPTTGMAGMTLIGAAGVGLVLSLYAVARKKKQ